MVYIHEGHLDDVWNDRNHPSIPLCPMRPYQMETLHYFHYIQLLVWQTARRRPDKIISLLLQHQPVQTGPSSPPLACTRLRLENLPGEDALKPAHDKHLPTLSNLCKSLDITVPKCKNEWCALILNCGDSQSCPHSGGQAKQWITIPCKCNKNHQIS